MSKRVISIQSEISISRSWDFWGLKPYVFSSYICLHIYKKSKKSNHRNSRFRTLKIVNRNKIRQSSWNGPPSFDYKNKAVINAYLTQYFRYCKFNSSSYRILPNPAWNLKKNTQNLNIFVRYAIFFVKNPRKSNVKMTQFDWSRNSRDSCPTSSDINVRYIFIEIS